MFPLQSHRTPVQKYPHLFRLLHLATESTVHSLMFCPVNYVNFLGVIIIPHAKISRDRDIIIEPAPQPTT